MAWYWDEDSWRFADKGGNFLTRAQLADYLERSIAESANVLHGLASRYLGGALTRDEFIGLVRAELKGEYIRQYLLGIGGRNQMTFSDWGRIGASLKEQYKYLNEFAKTLVDKGFSEAQLRNYLGMYVNSSREAFEKAFGKNASRWGADEELWILSGVTVSCDDCIDFSEQGWQEIGYFPEPGAGRTSCKTNCHCSKSYRNSVTQEEYYLD